MSITPSTSPPRLAPPASALAGKDLIRRIIDHARAHALEAGDRFPAERNLAQTLGVSRNALREALATLESLRVVELRPNSGVYLRALGVESSFEATVLLAELGTAPDAAEVRETIEVRAALERQAITLACARRTDANLEQLVRICTETRTVLARRGNITDCHYRVGTASVSNGATTSTYSVLVVLDVGHSNTSRRRSLSLLLLRFLRFLPYCLLVVVTAPGLSGRTAR